MTPNSAQFVRAATQISHTHNQQKVIREGSSVLVRIIADRGGGKYEASVAGNRLILSSSSALKIGSTFVGKIALQGGQIIISKNGVEATLTSPDIKTATFLESGGIFEKIISPELSGFLQALNLPTDNLSFHILLQYKQLGLKLDSTLMKKIRQIAAKSQNPKATAEKLISLAQKGIDINSTKLDAFLEDDFENATKYTHTDDETNSSPLALFNSLGFGKNHENESSWIFLPFKIENIAEKSIVGIVGNGIVKLLLRTNDKSLRMMNIEINYDEKSYRFLINLEGKKIASVKYSLRTIKNLTKNTIDTAEAITNIQENNKTGNPKIETEDKSITESLRNQLNSNGDEIKVEWIPYDLIDGTASGLEEFSLVGGFA